MVRQAKLCHLGTTLMQGGTHISNMPRLHADLRDQAEWVEWCLFIAEQHHALHQAERP